MTDVSEPLLAAPSIAAQDRPFRARNAPKIDYKCARFSGRYVSERGKIVPAESRPSPPRSSANWREPSSVRASLGFCHTSSSNTLLSIGWEGVAVSNRYRGTAEDMPIGILVGLGSGLVSGLLFYSAARGGPLLRPLLLLLIPLPSLVAGFGWGWIAAAAAALSGAIVVGMLVASGVVVGYSLTVGIPVALASYLAYLGRPHASDPANAGVIRVPLLASWRYMPAPSHSCCCR